MFSVACGLNSAKIKGMPCFNIENQLVIKIRVGVIPTNLTNKWVSGVKFSLPSLKTLGFWRDVVMTFVIEFDAEMITYSFKVILFYGLKMITYYFKVII